MPAFKASLIEQIDQELKLVRFILKELNARDEALALCEQKLSSGEAEANAKKSQELAMAMTGILDTMDKDKRQYLSEKLAHAGFEIKSLDDDYLIWNSREHADSYNTVGLVNDGDRCRILKRAASVNGKIIKGNVQRVAGIGDS